MHLKLEKFAHLCHNMNNESAARSEDSKVSKNQLEKLRTERDQQAVEIEELRAAVNVYEKEREDHRRVQDRMTTYENQGLQQLEEAIAERDQTIAKLSARLGTTLDTLAAERAQQRQRRQIFFRQVAVKMRNGIVNSNDHARGGGQNDDSSTATNNNNHADSSQQAELERLRAELLESQRKLETSQLEAKQRETALRFRCELLEKKVDHDGTKAPGRKPPTSETHPPTG